MSNTNASIPRSISGLGASEAASEPYRLHTGTPVSGSVPPSVAIMSWASPRTPCSGPNSTFSCSPCCANRSAACRSSRSTLVGLHSSASRWPRRTALCSSSTRSSPSLTTGGISGGTLTRAAGCFNLGQRGDGQMEGSGIGAVAVDEDEVGAGLQGSRLHVRLQSRGGAHATRAGGRVGAAIVVVAAQLGAGAAHLADVDHRVQRLRHGCAGGRNQRAHRRGQPVLVHFLGRGRESGAAGREQAGARGGAVGLAGGGDVDDLCVHAG